MLDCLTLDEIGNLDGFGALAVAQIKEARGLGSPKGAIDLTDPHNYMDSILGEPDVEAPDEVTKADDGLEELVLVLRLPPRRVDWLNRLSTLGQEINPKIPERFTVEALVVQFINEARQRDDTDAGRRNSQTTQRR